jgi:peptide/nickel transport system substrate-binding protein
MSWDKKELTRRDVLKFGAVGAGLVVLGPAAAACGGGGSSTSASASPGASAGPKTGGSLIIGRAFQPTVQAEGLDPHNVAVSSGNVYTLDKMYETLYVTDAKGALQPWLVDSHEVTTDGMTYTLALKQGVTFNDGKPMAADDVAWSLNRARLSKTGSMSFLNFAIKDVTAVDPATVKIKLSQPWAPLLSDLSIYSDAILPKDLNGLSEKEFFANPVGSGPFMLKSWAQQGAEITLARNPNYWQSGQPYLDEVVFKVIMDDNQRVLQVQSGQVQVIDTVPPAQVASLQSNSGLMVGIFPAWSADLIFFNEKVKQFADRNVRRAIAYTIDTKGIASATTFDTSQPGGSFFPPSLEYYNANTPMLSYDIAAAKAELAKSGYPNGFDTALLIPTGNQVWAQTAQILQAGMKQIGINMTIDQKDHAAYENDFRGFNYDMMINNAINDISDPDEMASFQCDPENGGSESFWTGYNNPEVVKLVRAAAAEMDSTKRGEMYSQIQAMVAQDAPFVALTYPPSIYVTTAKVNGFAVNPAGAYPLGSVWLT